MEDFCRGCCSPYGPQQAQCCRVLSGNFGKIVRLYEVYPRVIDTVSQPITIYGHGFDNNARLNKVNVGGKSCPVLNVDVSTVTLDGNLTCLAPSGFGKDIMPIIISVGEGGFSTRVVEGLCCSEAPIAEENLNGELPPQGTGKDGVTYRPPEVYVVDPRVRSFVEGQSVTITGRYFGVPTLFDENGVYTGAIGLALPRSEYTPPEAKLVMRQKDVVDCLSTQHISDSSLVCNAPEMTALNASIVIVATGLHSKLWAESSIIYADQLPGFKYECPVEKTGRCYDCCEASCHQQFEMQGGSDVLDVDLEFGGYHAFCSKECWSFCGYSEVDAIARH